MQPGGGFAKAGLSPPFSLTAARGPHSLAEAEDGSFYLTDAIGSALIRFDPVTKTFRHFDIGHGALYPHTIRVAKDGIVWFTIFASNQIGRFDPATGKTTVIYLPSKSVNAGLFVAPLPYGIDINPKDGSVWYAHFGNDTIGRVDPLTFEVREMESPVHAPRRQRFDASGTLWVAGFSDGAIARINVDTWQARCIRCRLSPQTKSLRPMRSPAVPRHPARLRGARDHPLSSTPGTRPAPSRASCTGAWPPTRRLGIGYDEAWGGTPADVFYKIVSAEEIRALRRRRRLSRRWVRTPSGCRRWRWPAAKRSSAGHPAGAARRQDRGAGRHRALAAGPTWRR
jgi:hypothetical protein